MKEYLKLLRIKHYIKNLLVFMPLFFSGNIFNVNLVLKCVYGFICFSLLSSAIYIFNDYKDIEKDRRHPTKKNRPLASGKIKPTSALILMVCLLIIVVIISYYIGNVYGGICLLLYYILNLGYSMGLKDKPIIDIIILSSGFVIRVFYGGFITGIEISKWLFLVITTGSLYMGLGKRRNELQSQNNTRPVLKYYNESFLDKNMYVCVALANVFYALWTLELPNKMISWTSPFFLIILMKYSLDIEQRSDGDPVEVIIKDKSLILLCITYAICLSLLLYIK